MFFLSKYSLSTIPDPEAEEKATDEQVPLLRLDQLWQRLSTQSPPQA